MEDLEGATRRLARKGVDPDLPARAAKLAAERLDLVRSVDKARFELNAGNSRVGELMRSGQREEAEKLKSEMSQARQALDLLEERLRAVAADLEDALGRIPNFPADSAPDGRSEADNVVVRTAGYDPGAYKGRSWKPHWEVAEGLGVYDPTRAAKLSGAMFSLLRGDGAKLLRALVNFGLDLHREDFEEVAPPHLVRTEVIERTGHLTKFDTQAYRLKDDELWLVPTAEVPLMGMHQGEILSEAELPRKYVAYTVCWRREAGAAGRDTRGLQRLHEFHKVELVVLCRPEDGEAELEKLVAEAERPLRLLGLPYRVVELCSGDLTFTSAKVYDLEVYSPGVDRWLEVSSVSLITDFQARRGQIRFRRESGTVELVHSLNGSGLATPRVWAALVEHGQQPDGSVRLPEALVPYMGQNLINPRR